MVNASVALPYGQRSMPCRVPPTGSMGKKHVPESLRQRAFGDTSVHRHQGKRSTTPATRPPTHQQPVGGVK